MKVKSIVTIVVAAMVMLLFPVHRVAANPEYVTYYTVRYACIISPPMYGHIEGEWTEWCNGSWTGWGWEPGHNCTYTDITYGNACGGGGGGGGGGCHPCDY